MTRPKCFTAGYKSLLLCLLLAAGCSHRLTIERTEHPGEAIYDAMSADPRLPSGSIGANYYPDHPELMRIYIEVDENRPLQQASSIAAEYQQLARARGINVRVEASSLEGTVNYYRHMIQVGEEFKPRLKKLLEIHGKTEADFPSDSKSP